MKSLLSFVVRGRVSPRRATHFLCFAKESKQRKATPTVCVPPLRYGQPAVLDSGGGPQNSLRSNSCGPDPASICAPRRIQKGWRRDRPSLRSAGSNLQYQTANTNHRRRAAPAVARWPSEAKARSVSKPLCMRRGAQGFADQGSQLSERSEFCETPRNPSTAGCPQRSAGSQTVGSPFLCLLSFGEAKESESPAGATPGLGNQAPVDVQTGASQ